MEKKIIWKLNLIDIIILLLVILSIAALAYKAFWGSSNNMQNFEIICICDEAPSKLLYGITQGSECIDGASGNNLGKVVKTEIEPVEENSDKSKGIISLIADGTKNDHGISIGDTVYLKGSIINLIIGDSVFNVYISDIR